MAWLLGRRIHCPERSLRHAYQKAIMSVRVQEFLLLALDFIILHARKQHEYAVLLKEKHVIIVCVV